MFNHHKQPAWTCKCGAVIPKHGAQLSGHPSGAHGYHIHCPNCSKTVATHINPKETQLDVSDTPYKSSA